ncbi:MAG: MarR family winged helix-turn-helix transcriptional regulator [Butyricicoccus sp.]
MEDTVLLAQREQFNRLFKEQDNIYRRVAQQLGLSDTAFWILYQMRDSSEPFTQSELCHDWYLSKQTVNSAVSGLVKSGLISLKAAVGNGHRKLLLLTDAGTAFCSKHIDPLIQADIDSFSSFTEQERTLLLTLMQKQLDLLQKGFHDETHSTV